MGVRFQPLIKSGFTIEKTIGSGSGDVIAPATNTANYIPQWDGANSKTLKNGLSVPEGGLAGITALGNKVDQVIGKGLSTEDYTSDEKTKLSGIATGAEVNVNADWNSTTGDSQILNKPTIPDELADLTADSTHRTVTDTEKSTWNGKQDALGFTAENSSNKENTTIDTSTTKYPTINLLKTGLDGKLNKSAITITENTALNQTNSLVISNSSSAITITLPTVASSSGLVLSIKNINTGIVTIDGNGSETIDGVTTIRLENTYDSVIIGCNGSAWFILGGKWRQTSFV